MALVSDPSLEGFNSFVSVAEADEYFSGVYFGSSKKWSDFIDETEKEALLITATRRLNSLPWAGSTYSDSQALAFPRNFAARGEYGYSYFPNVAPVPVTGWIPVGDADDEVIPETFIPVWLKQAVYETAFWIWAEDERPATDAEFSMLKSMKIGPLDYAFRDSSGSTLAPAVVAILNGLGPTVIDMGTGARSMRMVY